MSPPPAASSGEPSGSVHGVESAFGTSTVVSLLGQFARDAVEEMDTKNMDRNERLLFLMNKRDELTVNKVSSIGCFA